VPETTGSPELRRGVYGLLIALALGACAGRILAVDSVDKYALEAQRHQEGRKDWSLSRPFLSANDRSRWCTMRALVEQGTYAIDDIQSQKGWDTIDMVQHDGHLYSSKPPLFPTLLAGAYWLIYQTTGATLETHPYEIGRGLLLLVNGGGLLVYFLVMARLVERYGQTDWGRICTFAVATGGTFLTTFAVTLNNHLPAAVSAAIALDATLRIYLEGDRRPFVFAIAGLATAFAAANELPALILVPFVAAALVSASASLACRIALPTALLVATGFFGTNYAAHGSVVPAYGHRDWYDYSFERNGRQLDSYWRHREGLDRGEPEIARYAWHVLLGHHGVFSLTPVWLLSMAGLYWWLRDPRPHARRMAAAIATMSLICLLFYIFRPLIDRNYGGMTSGFRWMFWFAPLWLWAMLPAADWMARSRWRQGIALTLLALSVMSASYPTWNPWRHPWLYNLLQAWCG
jgi:hypothetical protein